MARRDNADVEALATADETEETVESPAEAGAEKVSKAKGPKRGDLPEGVVTPVGLAKILTEKKLHTNKAGEIVAVAPQMVYSYMKNSTKDDRLETHAVTDSAGVERQVLDIDKAVAWWERKNTRTAERKANAAAKATKAAEKAAAKPAEEAEGSTEPAVEAE